MRKLLHLHWRAGFGLSPQEWQAKQNLSISQAVDQLFQEANSNYGILDAPNLNFRPQSLSKEEREKLVKEGAKQVMSVNGQWIERMASPAYAALLERMTLFWHGHFACRSRFGKLATTQLNTLREHALGNFRDLAVAIAKDPAMIRYLNNQQNKKNKPNENFARELMELFTLGRGNYTEQDIKEAARAFTGWSSNLNSEYVFRRFQHDYGSKTVFGKTGNFDGTDIIDLILEKREAAVFLTRKIYRYFVNEKPNEGIIQDLANSFYNSDYHIGKLMRQIFESDWFYDDGNIGTKIKSPVDLIAGIMRSLQVEFENPRALVFVQKALGQTLFNPPNVAGWPGGKIWIDNATLMLRLNLVSYLFNASDMNLRVKDDLKAQVRGKAKRRLKASVNLTPFVQALQHESESQVFDSLRDFHLLASTSISKASIDSYTIRSNKDTYIKSLNLRLMSLPEYQLC